TGDVELDGFGEVADEHGRLRRLRLRGFGVDQLVRLHLRTRRREAPIWLSGRSESDPGEEVLIAIRVRALVELEVRIWERREVNAGDRVVPAGPEEERQLGGAAIDAGSARCMGERSRRRRNADADRDGERDDAPDEATHA